MPLTVQQPFGRDVTKKNPIEFIYLKGDADTDGSLRLKPDFSSLNFEVQLRSDGVWNTTGLQVSAATIFLGRDVSISGAGDWIQQNDIDGDIQAILTHIEYNDNGTQELPHTIRMEPKIIRQIIQPDDSSEVLASTITYFALSPISALRTDFYYKTGSVGGASPVKVTVQKDNSSGLVIFEKNYPASLFQTPNTEIKLSLEGFVEAAAGDVLFISLLSDTDMNFKSNPSGDLWIALDLFPISIENIVTVKIGMERILTSKAGDTISDKQGNIILRGGIAS